MSVRALAFGERAQREEGGMRHEDAAKIRSWLMGDW
jgi:hypothetical protein